MAADRRERRVDPADARRDQRENTRTAFTRPLPVRDARSGALIGLLDNLTHSGLRLKSDYRMPVGRSLNVTIDLLETLVGKRDIELRMQCRWCHRKIGSGQFDAGFRFVDNGFRQKLMLDALLSGELVEDGEFRECANDPD